jgi:hypothetical protein
MADVPVVMLDVFVASMACPCGSGRADKADAAMNEALLELQRRFKGRIGFRIHALNLHLPRFRNTPAVAALLREKGHGALPVAVIGDAIVFQGRMTHPDDLEKAVAPYVTPGGP